MEIKRLELASKVSSAKGSAMRTATSSGFAAHLAASEIALVDGTGIPICAEPVFRHAMPVCADMFPLRC